MILKGDPDPCKNRNLEHVHADKDDERHFNIFGWHVDGIMMLLSIPDPCNNRILEHNVVDMEGERYFANQKNWLHVCPGCRKWCF